MVLNRFAAMMVMMVMAGLSATTSVMAQEDSHLKGIKCMICKMQVTTQDSVDYKGGKVYFGCGGCPATFQKNLPKYAARANAQLVATHQTHQKKCPVMGGAVKEGLSMKVAGANVGFCCPMCKTKLAQLSPEDQVEKVFSEAAFAKAFEVHQHKH